MQTVLYVHTLQNDRSGGGEAKSRTRCSMSMELNAAYSMQRVDFLATELQLSKHTAKRTFISMEQLSSVPIDSCVLSFEVDPLN